MKSRYKNIIICKGQSYRLLFFYILTVMHNPFDLTIFWPKQSSAQQSPSKQAVANPLFCLDGFPIKAFGNDRI
ncbi:MAG: hypothetical protein DWQ05_07540 [Calditrichaeota bacterium]|nr:MAG: hypothetical protein DWQ05_07540 [Calditrichota bacterium]